MRRSPDGTQIACLPPLLKGSCGVTASPRDLDVASGHVQVAGGEPGLWSEMGVVGARAYRGKPSRGA